MLKNQNKLLKWQGTNNKRQIEINIHNGKKKQNRMLFSCIIARIIKTCALFWQACSTTLQLCFVRVGICFWVWRKGRQMQEEFWGGAWRRGEWKRRHWKSACLPTSQSTEQIILQVWGWTRFACSQQNEQYAERYAQQYFLTSTSPNSTHVKSTWGRRCLVTSVPQQNLTFQFQYLQPNLFALCNVLSIYRMTQLMYSF